MAKLIVKTPKVTAPVSSKKGTEYPVFPATPTSRKLVSEFLKVKAQFEALNGALKSYAGQLKEMAVAPYYEQTQGKVTPASTIVFDGQDDFEHVGIQFKSIYSRIKWDDIEETIGEQKTSTLFNDSLQVDVSVDKIAKPSRNKTITALVNLLAENDSVDAIKFAIDGTKIDPAKQQAIYEAIEEIKSKNDITDDQILITTVASPKEEFHVARHTQLTLEENIQLAAVTPCVQAIVKRN